MKNKSAEAKEDKHRKSTYSLEFARIDVMNMLFETIGYCVLLLDFLFLL